MGRVQQAGAGGAFTVILLERTVLILDGATAKEHARLSDFIEPSRLVFAPASEEAPPTP